ncbi:cilia- and flagella-associated protein 91-like [Nymphalis io]|uniref:cilia- and flagella-associated protein 91-like n=1 Tax=Inachis io TaxID=171585 RepID=UPI0021692442|nr:cilia- and flagella-associated protein 91-like [Nymphalis io]
MSGETLYEAPRRYNVSKMRVHDYLYDSAFIVSGARDYARTAFKAAMASAQVMIQPVYKTMFSELRQFPRMQVVYHPNCRLPPHVDRSYGAYLEKVGRARGVPVPELAGKDRFKYCAVPKKLCPMKCATPDFRPPTELMIPCREKPKHRGTQSLYRESSAQTTPWQPDAVPAEECENTPEVMYLDKFEWGPGTPYRKGDLPADFHTTEMINKMRHARRWSELVERGGYPRWIKNREGIITDIETKDWIFREAEIDELQDIRLALLHKLQTQKRKQSTDRTVTKLAKLWADKKTDMERKIDNIRRKRDRELRKLTTLHNCGGRMGLVQEMRAARGGGSAINAAQDPTSDLHAPRARHGYQARRRHAEIIYDPNLLSLEDHEQLSAPPVWLQQCGQNLSRTCSGHHIQRDTTQLCERETKWSEQFLEKLHNDLKKARLGAASASAGPLRVLKPRRLVETPRPPTPEMEAVPEEDEASHQAALTLQKVLRGRAVQILMFEGRTRAAELTEELKTTHGLQKEDRARIAKEESRARDYQAIRSEAEQKEEAISALVEELCGGAVSAALDFLEKELRRLKEERRQHAFILIALREKTLREAAEAGRRQKEEHRRREHDEMFKQVLGVTHETVDAYLRDVTREAVELAAEEQAVRRARARADAVQRSLREHGSMSTAEQNELVAELVHQFLLPEAHKAASRHRVSALQATKLEAARSSIFDVVDGAEVKIDKCTRCGRRLDDQCKCRFCEIDMKPMETMSRDDSRWKHTRRRDDVTKSTEERFPPQHDIRYLLDDIVDDAVYLSRLQRKEGDELMMFVSRAVREANEIAIDAREAVEELISRATGDVGPIKTLDYHHYMRRIHEDALARTEPFKSKTDCPAPLPSELRRRAEEALVDDVCHCREDSKVQFSLETMDTIRKSNLLPSELRQLEELRRCKCDTDPSPSTTSVASVASSTSDEYEEEGSEEFQ